MKRAAKAIAKALDDSERVPGPAREHRRDAGPAGPQLRRARRADRAARRRRADRRLPRLLPPARLRLRDPHRRRARRGGRRVRRQGRARAAALPARERLEDPARRQPRPSRQPRARASSATMASRPSSPSRGSTSLPALLETPGPDGHGPDRADVEPRASAARSRPRRAGLRALPRQSVCAGRRRGCPRGPSSVQSKKRGLTQSNAAAVALVAGLDAELALGQRLAGHLDARRSRRSPRRARTCRGRSRPGRPCDAAHVAAAGELILVAVEVPAAASRGSRAARPACRRRCGSAGTRRPVVPRPRCS